MSNKVYFKILVVTLIAFALYSCDRYTTKKSVSIQLDIAFLTKPSFCGSNKLSEDINELYSPIILDKKNIGVFNGYIKRFDILPISQIAVKDSAENTKRNIAKSWFNKDETYDQTKSYYDAFIGEVSVAELCISSQINTNSLGEINSFIKANNYTRIFILSSTIKDTIWNDFKVYNKANELKDTISKVLKESSTSSFLAIIEPVMDNTNLGNEIKLTEPTVLKKDSSHARFDNEFLRKTLLEIANPKHSFEERKLIASEVIIKTFTNNFNVIMHEGNASAKETVWERGNGKNYLLVRLTADDSILDFQIIRADKSITDSKIAHIEIVEIHKTD